jgi:hypothetical protein
LCHDVITDSHRRISFAALIRRETPAALKHSHRRWGDSRRDDNVKYPAFNPATFVWRASNDPAVDNAANAMSKAVAINGTVLPSPCSKTAPHRRTKLRNSTIRRAGTGAFSSRVSVGAFDTIGEPMLHDPSTNAWHLGPAFNTPRFITANETPVISTDRSIIISGGHRKPAVLRRACNVTAESNATTSSKNTRSRRHQLR